MSTNLRQILTQSYNQIIWKETLEDIFQDKLEWHLEAQDVTENKLIQSIYELGTITLENAELVIYEVCVNDYTSINRNRVQLRNITKQYFSSSFSTGALVIFYEPSQSQWRFSFIYSYQDYDETIEDTVKKESHTKRYTYVLGENENCLTAVQRFQSLKEKAKEGELQIEDLQEVFSVEKISKEFFKKYKAHYEKFNEYLYHAQNGYRKLFEAEEDAKKEKKIRDFNKKLLGRIVFLYFLQKKGWLGVPKENSSEDFTGGNPRFISDLFQQAKNEDKATHFYSDYLAELFFNALNKDGKKRPDLIFPPTDSKIPYLNGGLFENQYPETRQINFPVAYFEDLFQFLNEYNFTIDESRPDEHEIGIDPEMLGHIFENLLEDNKDKGAFYTPKEIVHYMCQESLIQYLNTHSEGKITPMDITHFVRQKETTDTIKQFKHHLLQLLDKVKICDPAIGSGAFPMGMLNEIFYCILALQPSSHRAKTKLNIIKNCIYGVDIDAGAVDIARLRFWLSLVVDEDQPQPLPNLDFKIMQGNSLLESFEGIDLSELIFEEKEKTKRLKSQQMTLFNSAQQMSIKFDTQEKNSIETWIKKFFNARKNHRKKELKEKIDRKIYDSIKESLRKNKLNLIDRHQELKIQFQAKVVAKKSVSTKLTRGLQLLENEIKSYEEKNSRLEQTLQKSEKPYFLWHLYFSDVLNSKNKGFDIVIGNPPYVQLQKMGDRATELQNVSENYKTYSRTGDIYELFYEQGMRLLKPKGILTYITSNKWMRAKYGESTRAYFSEQYNPLTLIDFGGMQVFENATVDTNILMLQKAENKRTTIACKLDSTYERNTPLAPFLEKHHVIMKDYDENTWMVSDRINWSIQQKIRDKGIALEAWDIKINFGIKTGYNTAFLIDKSTKCQLVEEDAKNIEIIKPILRGRDIQKYKAEVIA